MNDSNPHRSQMDGFVACAQRISGASEKFAGLIFCTREPHRLLKGVARPTPPHRREDAGKPCRIGAHQQDDDGGEHHHAPLAPGREPSFERVDRQRAYDRRNE